MPTSLETQYINLALQAGLVPPEKASQAVAVAEAIRGRGAVADVRTVMIGRRMLSHEDAETLLGQMSQIVMRCAVCGSDYTTKNYDSKAVCSQDGAPLKPTLAPRSGATSVGPTPAPRPGMAAAVRAAAAPGVAPVGAPGAIRTAVPVPTPSPALKTVAVDPAAMAQVGRWFGNFQLKELLNQGNSSLIYRAELQRTEMPFVVKLLTGRDETARKRFMREAKLASFIDHPNVVTVIEVGEFDGIFYIAMEYVPGKSLQTILDEQPGKRLPLREAVSIALPILDGLEAAHQMGVVHRDLKPANIVVGEVDVKILDFGLARQDDNEGDASSVLTAAGTTLGTPHYMAPEQVSSSRVDYRADLYAFGSTFFQMLVGQTPFTGRDAMSILMAKMQQDPPTPSSLNPEIPAKLDEVILKLLAREPKSRFPSASHVAQAIHAAL